MRKAIILFSLIMFAFSAGCREKEENKIEKGVKDITDNVNKQLNKVNDAAEQNKKDFGNKINEESKNLGDKATNVINKAEDSMKKQGEESGQ